MDVLSTEATAFLRAADVAGLELPDAIAEAAAVMARLEVERKALPVPEPVPSLSALIASGVAPDKAQKEREKLMVAARQAEELRKATWKAYGAACRKVSILVAEERDTLIHGLRPITTALIEKARPLAETLAPFAPKYDAGTIVRHASMEQVEAWREAEELERQFGACLAAWRAAFNSCIVHGGHKSPARVEGFDHRDVEQAHYYWTWPERVLEPRLNGTYYGNPNSSFPSRINPTVLAVACERPECGFRLATMTEVAEIFYAANEEARIERDHRERRFQARAI